MKKFGILAIVLVFGCLSFPTFSQQGLENTENNLHIIPKSSKDGKSAAEYVKEVGSGEGTVIERYNKQATEIAEQKDLGKAFETGIINWDTLLSYIVYLMRFINQLGLLIGSIMILYAGYQYAGTIFKFGDPTKGKNAIKNAIIGILVIVFSYAIWKALESMFL